MSNIEVTSKEQVVKKRRDTLRGGASRDSSDLMADLVPATAFSVQSQPTMQSIGSAGNSVRLRVKRRDTEKHPNSEFEM